MREQNAEANADGYGLAYDGASIAAVERVARVIAIGNNALFKAGI